MSGAPKATSGVRGAVVCAAVLGPGGPRGSAFRVPIRAAGPRLLLALAMLLSAGACGFRLRGTLDVPAELNPMLIEAPQGSRVRGAIVERLEGSQVRLAQGRQDARVVVRLGNERQSSRVIAVDRDGKVLARELLFGVDFEAVAPDGKSLVPKQDVDVVRSYDNPDVEVLGKQREAELIMEDMVNDAADRILIRLRAALL